MTRPGWDEWFMRIAYAVAERGSCKRKKVGAIVVRDRDKRIISTGYNGAPRGMPDCLDVGCDVRVIDGRESCVRTLHAESNALDLCGPLAEPHTIYTTVIPCRNCALRIVQHGITRVVYHEFYQSQGTLEVKAIFERQDPATLKQLEEKHFGPPEEAGYRIVPRVRMIHLDTLIPETEAVRKLLWEIYSGVHSISIGLNERKALETLCWMFGVQLEPDDA
jgi:dCMP deaminase